MTPTLHHGHAGVRSDVRGDGVPSCASSPPERRSGQLVALELLCRLETACGQGTGVVSAVTFQGALIDLCTTDGERETFPGVKDLGLYVEATITAHAQRRPARAPGVLPPGGPCWLKWCGVLADLAAGSAAWGAPGLPGEVFAVHRLPTLALIAVHDGVRTEVRSLGLEEGPQRRRPGDYRDHGISDGPDSSASKGRLEARRWSWLS